MSPAELSAALGARRPVDDEAFDALLSARARFKSSAHWSKVAVAQQAAAWFDEVGAQRLLDVGAGLGKFCIVAALWLDRPVCGVEQRAHLVEEGRALAKALQADVQLVEGDLRAVEPSGFDGLYFYNPFAEHVANEHERYDDTVPLSTERYLRHARVVERWLRELRVGSHFISYNGIGSRIPTSWEVTAETKLGGSLLRRWRKVRREVGDDALLEVGEQLVSCRALQSLTQRHPTTKDAELVARLVRPFEVTED